MVLSSETIGVPAVQLTINIAPAAGKDFERIAVASALRSAIGAVVATAGDFVYIASTLEFATGTARS
jgi:hypothetical protein